MTTTTSDRSTTPPNKGASRGRTTGGSAPSPRGPRTRGLRRPAGLAGALVLVLAVLAGAGWLVGFSPVLAVERVEVTGARRLAASYLREAAAVPLGVPLARQDLTLIARRVSSLPQIESTEVSRRWPNTIRIAVEERRPVLGVRQPEAFVLIDSHGVAFESQPSLPSGVLLADVDPSNVAVLVEVGAIATAMPAALRGRVERLMATSRSAVTVVLSDGVRVNWGTAADSALKADIVLALLKREPSTIDVSSPHNPAIR
jgi:cell division protein FtsQ